MPGQTSARLRHPWPFKRVALVLSGGGAFGAYEVGVLRVLDAVGLNPAIVAGVSVGAINAVVWLSHGRTTSALEAAWRSLSPSSLGMRWSTLALRAAGALLAVVGGVELILALAGIPGLGIHSRLGRLAEPWGFEFYSIVFESFAWLALALAGIAMASLSTRLEELLAHWSVPTDPERGVRWLGIAVLAGIALYLIVVFTGTPWPVRFHVMVLLVGSLVWLLNQPGRPRDWLRRFFLRLMPETRGRGLWRGVVRRRFIEKLVASGDPARLVSGDPHVIISACAVDTGRMSYFTNWTGHTARFQKGIEQSLGDIVDVLTVKDVVMATTASCAVPILFEPVRFRGHDYLDAGVFSNQPLHAVVADGADAILMVLVSPSSGPRKPGRDANVIDLGSRVQELSNWRDLQGELRRLPSGWTREGDPARICVVEPAHPLPGAMFAFELKRTKELMSLGERDAWKALADAGWLAE